MIRIILWNLFLFLLPFILSWAWSLYLARAKPDQIRKQNYARAAAIGTAMVIIGLIVLRATSGDEPGKTYVSPSYQDGEIVPGRFE